MKGFHGYLTFGFKTFIDFNPFGQRKAIEALRDKQVLRDVKECKLCKCPRILILKVTVHVTKA